MPAILDLLAKYGKHRPAWAPFTTPMYSNVAFSFLSFVIEQVTNKTFDEHVQESIFTPLGMDSTTSGAKPEDDASGFIPAEDPWWFLNLGVFNPYVACSVTCSVSRTFLLIIVPF